MQFHYDESEFDGCKTVPLKDRFEVIHEALACVFDELDDDDNYIQSDDVEDDMRDIDFQVKCLTRTNPDDPDVIELVRLFNTLDREMYAAKGAMEEVKSEMMDMASHVKMVLNKM